MVTTRNKTNAKTSSAEEAPKVPKKAPNPPASGGRKLKRPTAKLAASQTNKKAKVTHDKNRARAKSSPPKEDADSDDEDADNAQSSLEVRNGQEPRSDQERQLRRSTAPRGNKTKNVKAAAKPLARRGPKEVLESDDENEPEEAVDGERNRSEPDDDEPDDDEPDDDEPDDDEPDDSEPNGNEYDNDEDNFERSPQLSTKPRIIKVKSKSARIALLERRKQDEQARKPPRVTYKRRGASAQKLAASNEKYASDATTSGDEDFEDNDGRDGNEHDYDDLISGQDGEDLDIDVMPSSSYWKISDLELFDDSANDAVQQCIHETKRFWTELDDGKMLKSRTKLVCLLELHKPWNLATDIIKTAPRDASDYGGELWQLVTALVVKLKHLDKRKNWRHPKRVLHDFYTTVYPALALLVFMTISALGPDCETGEEEIDRTTDAVSCIVSLIVAIAELEHRLITHLFPDVEKRKKAAKKTFVKQTKTLVGPCLAQIERSFKSKLKRPKSKIQPRNRGGRDEPVETVSSTSSRAGRMSPGEAERNRQIRDRANQGARKRALREQHHARRAEFQRLEALRVARLDATKRTAPFQQPPPHSQRRPQTPTSEDDSETSWNEDWESLGDKLSSSRLDERETRIIQDDRQSMLEQRIDYYKPQIWKRLCEINDEKSINMGAQARIQYCVDDDEIRRYCTMNEEQVVEQLKQLVRWALETQGKDDQGSEGSIYNLGWMEHFVREWALS